MQIMPAKLGPYLLGPNDENQGIYTGDARELARAIPDESVDLIFTDPVYDRIEDYRWLAETAARVLKHHKSMIAFCGHLHTMNAAAASLTNNQLLPGPILEHYVAGAVGRIFSHSVQANVLPALWLSRGTPSSKWMAVQERSIAIEKRGHKWAKAEAMAKYRISRLTGLGEIVIDPFCGGGSHITISKMLGRRWLAFEIDPATAEIARQRIMQTQPPLFVMQPEQMEMTLKEKG